MDDNTFFMVMFSAGAAMGVVTLIYVLTRAFGPQPSEIGGWELRGARARVAAVARTTLAEGIRAKVASGFALLILVSIPLFWLTAEGDGTIKGKVQMFLTYSLGFSAFVLALLTILFSCRSLSVEVASRQIYSIVTKPIPRWQIIAGKWCGVMTLNVLLLILASLATYAGALGLVARFKSDLRLQLETSGGLPPTQADRLMTALDHVTGAGRHGMESPIITAFADALGMTREQTADVLIRLPEPTRVNLRRFDELRRQVLVARAALAAPLPDPTAAIEEYYQALKKEGRLPEGWTERRIREQIKNDLVARFSSVSPGETRQWRVKGPPPEKGTDQVMSVRFKLRVPAQLLAGRYGGRTLEADTIICRWGLGDPAKPSFVSTPEDEAYPVNTFYEVEIPQEGIEPDGTVILNFLNSDPRKVDAIFDLANSGLEVLYRIGPFELSLFQASLAILIPLACLASFGVCASTFLSFPVGSLIVLTLYVIASSMGFLADSLAVTKEYAPAPHDRTAAFEIRRVTVETLGWVLSLGDTEPVDKLMEGRAVGWAALAENAGKFVLGKGLAVMFIAVLIFRRRELAAVIV